MNWLRRRFTKWYVKHGYIFRYDFSGVPIYGDELLRCPGGLPKPFFDCPFWVKPLLLFFSPSIYYAEALGRAITEGLVKGASCKKRV